ncbi:MAG: murI [Clostridiaceae bacterium]|nr:murI [Clostridiaceae bacterium]
MDLKYKPIGFFDSGVGGLSVLKQAVKLLPNEDYIYFGDSKNAPYGTRSVEEVKKLTFKAVDFLIGKDVKAVVIACNTATSAAIKDLREKYKEIPVVGIEPALKPAVECGRSGKILIMATPMTLAERKFEDLLSNYKDFADIEPLPCAGLVELIENGILEGKELNQYLNAKLAKYKNNDIGAIVLGCTHYPFIKEELSKILDSSVPVVDGSLGTAKQLKRELNKNNMLNDKFSKGSVEIYNSLEDKKIIELSRKLLNI